ncbi:hypothetical protein [Amycolatopsis nigrescens]|uniref:T4 family baseplate hub assembly chaperone n=1 Tax=Amycolatopsis nigrescens TaxID=381445 RepID=UPI00035D6134|nr:hypothetical protein [Amycolatopsis nigrescens]
MLAGTDLLAAWESGAAAGGGERTVLLHALARPVADPEELLGVPLGIRDAELFALRRSLFGTRIPVRVSCPDCAEELEFEFDTAAVAGLPGGTAGEPVTVTSGEWTVLLRPPTSGDLLAAGHAGTAAMARAELLSRCVLSAERAGAPARAGELPAEVQRAVAERAAEADPCADIRLDLGCPECGRRVRAELDISACLWAELDSWARATLLEVYQLAAALGWSEPQILALSPLRRRYYLELAGHA